MALLKAKIVLKKLKKAKDEAAALTFKKYFPDFLNAKQLMNQAEEEADDLTQKLADESALLANLTWVANQIEAEEEAADFTFKKYFPALLNAKQLMKEAEEEADDLTNKLAYESAALSNLTVIPNQIEVSTKAENETMAFVKK